MVWKIAQHYFSGPTSLALLLIVSIHPTTVEVIHWASIRKTLLVGFFMGIASFLVLKKSWDPLPSYNLRYYATVLGLWLISLLCWPTAILWIVWFLWMHRILWQTHKERFAVCSILSLAFIYTYSHFVTSGAKDYSEGANELLNLTHIQRSFNFAWKALGQGFFNLILPYQLNPFYDELNPQILYGLAFFIAVVVFVYKKILETDKQSSNHKWQSLDLFFLGAILFIPQSFVFITFNEYVWADRYTYIALPYLVLAFFLLIPRSQLKRGLYVLIPWVCLSTFTTCSYIPLWRDDRLLMNACAKSARSPKCFIQSIQKDLNFGGCAAAFATILDGAERYRSSKPLYAAEFNIELPFYHAYCIGTMVTGTQEQRMRSMEELFALYNGSPEIVPAMVLVQLRSNQVEMAWQSAHQYYLKKGKIAATKNLLNVYRGQGKALCEFYPTIECLQALHDFEVSHKNIEQDPDQILWGYKATKESYMTRSEK